MNQTKKTTSIARRINADYWFDRLFDIIGLNIIIFLLLAGTFLMMCIEKIPGNVDVWQDISSISFVGQSYSELRVKISLKDIKDETNTELQDNEIEELNRSYLFYVHEFFDYAELPALILFAAETLQLLGALFKTGRVRRKLRPLNELAVQAEQLSNLPLDATSLEHLEQAIMNVSPDAQEARISTGDKDLQSIEVALNNLFLRMKESQRQQTRFVSDASHELRTPISVIQGYVNMLDRWGKEDESVLDESIEALKNESEHMKELVEQLLFLARGDSGRNVLKPVEFDLREVVQEVWEESIMIDSSHKYVFEQAVMEDASEEKVTAERYIMTGDVAMVKQSIRILVQNAAKYSNEGDTITFSVKKSMEHVAYLVQDEGIGMCEADVSHIFERFYRSDKARNGETGGSGLGLSIAKWIVDAHRGNIEVLSRPDFGTRFTVSFPRWNE